MRSANLRAIVAGRGRRLEMPYPRSEQREKRPIVPKVGQDWLRWEPESNPWSRGKLVIACACVVVTLGYGVAFVWEILSHG